MNDEDVLDEEKDEQIESSPLFESSSEEILNKISLFGPIEEKTSLSFISNLIMLNEELEPQKEIEVYISTKGGDTDEMFGIIDTINLIKKKRDIKMICLGKVMSAGIAILASGTPGKRFASENTRFMLHEIIMNGDFGTNTFNTVEINESKAIQQKYINLISKTTKLSVKDIEKLISGGHHYYFGTKEAKKYGIIDNILRKI